MDYAALKVIHVSCAAISYAFFVTRGLWMMAGSKRLQQRWVKVVPQAIDTLLLASAIAMAAATRIRAAPWLTAKVVALVIYIALGTLAVKRGRTRRMRVAAWMTAQAVFLYIVAVAVTRNPLPWDGAMPPRPRSASSPRLRARSA